MTDYRVACITRPDRTSTHEHITHVGGTCPDGTGWYDPVPAVVGLIEAGQHRFYTREQGVVAWVYVRTSAGGRKFLQTRADGVWTNNLLALPDCR